MSDSRNDPPPSRGRSSLALCALVVTAGFAFACEGKDEVAATNPTVVEEVPEVAWREAETGEQGSLLVERPYPYLALTVWCVVTKAAIASTKRAPPADASLLSPLLAGPRLASEQICGVAT